MFLRCPDFLFFGKEMLYLVSLLVDFFRLLNTNDFKLKIVTQIT